MREIKPRRSRRDAAPVTAEELIEMRRFFLRHQALEQQLDAAAVAKVLGFKSKRTVLDLVREGAFPGAWKPCHNQVRIPVSAVHSFLEKRAVQPEGHGA